MQVPLNFVSTADIIGGKLRQPGHQFATAETGRHYLRRQYPVASPGFCLLPDEVARSGVGPFGRHHRSIAKKVYDAGKTTPMS